MANIKDKLNNIKNALYGKDVRGSIHDGIDAINREVEGTTEKQNKLSEQFKNLVINEGNSNAEIAASRGSHDWLPDRLDNFDSQLEHKANLNSVFSMANMGQDIKEAMTGGSVAVVGDNAILANNIVDGQVTGIKLADNTIYNNKLHDRYNYVKNLSAENNLDTINRAGIYLCIGKPINSPTQFGSSSYYLEVENYSTFYIQTAYKFNEPHIRYSRQISGDGVVTEWRSVSNNNLGELASGADFNTILQDGRYMSTTSWTNGPTDLLGNVVELDVSSYSSNYRWIKQECCFYQQPGVKYVRFIDKQGDIASSEWEVFKSVEQLWYKDNTIDGGDLNDVVKKGNYVFINSPTNNPLTTSSGILTVDVYNKNWIVQKVHTTGDTSTIYTRLMQRTSNNMIISSWEAHKSETSLFPLNNTITANNLDDVTKRGSYIYANNPSENPLSSISGALEVDVYNNRWVVQRAMHLKNQNEIYMRIIDTNSSSYYKSPWQSLVPPSSVSKLAGKVIVNFGDSIFGNTRGADSISGQISSITGATVYNCGFGGCRMSKHTGYWDAFSMYNLVDAIISKDFSAQETGANASDTSCPSYFKETVELLKGIDFNNVDYVTIAYGTNDYTASKNLDVGKGDKNIDAYAGALRYSIERLLNNFPHIKLLICTPIWRWWEAEEGISSDEKEYGGNTLLDYRDKVIEVCTDYHIPYLNGYDNVGINEFTKGYYFTSPDGTHPNTLGNKRYAETIIGRLEQM